MWRILRFLIFASAVISISTGQEQCSSYHYQEQTLSKVVRLQHRLELLENQVYRGGNGCCPDGWITFQGSCYLFYQTKANFNGAEAICETYGAHLVHVESEMENTFLQDTLKAMKEAHYWFGLTDINKGGPLKWHGTDNFVSFSDWDDGQPDNHGGDQNCGSFNHNMAFKWDDAYCLEAYKLICEKKAL